MDCWRSAEQFVSAFGHSARKGLLDRIFFNILGLFFVLLQEVFFFYFRRYIWQFWNCFLSKLHEKKNFRKSSYDVNNWHETKKEEFWYFLSFQTFLFIRLGTSQEDPIYYRQVLQSLILSKMVNAATKTVIKMNCFAILKVVFLSPNLRKRHRR